MKIYLAFMLLLSTLFSSYAQEKNGSLPYPDLIPILVNGLYGFCDKDKNIIIEPQFDWVSFFGEDLDFEDAKDPKMKILGSDVYATVWKDRQKMRIDNKGKVVYRYNSEDFNETHPKESMIPLQTRQPFEKFRDSKTKLLGIRNINSGEVLIQAQYPVIEEELYSFFHVPQYLLILVSWGNGENKFYVGLNGVEYRETSAAKSKTEGYKIVYRVHLSGSDSATRKLQELVTTLNSMGPFTSAYLTREKIRVEDFNHPSWTQIVNVSDGACFRYWTEVDSTKTVRLRDSTKSLLSFFPFSEEPFVDSAHLILTDDIQTVVGYTCSLARFNFGPDIEFLIWYVKDLPRLYFGKDEFFTRSSWAAPENYHAL